MSRLEDLVRAAQETQADRAAPLDRIRDALPGQVRLRRRRKQRWGAAGVVVAAAVAVAVPVLVVDRSAAEVSTKPCPTTMPFRSPGELSDPPPAIGIRYPRFAPAWLPTGYTGPTEPPIETRLRHPDTLTGIWTASDGSQISVDTRIETTETAGQLDRSGRSVDVNGHTGYYRTSSVDWALAEPPVVLTVSGDLPEQELLRVARSVQPDWARRSYRDMGGFDSRLCGLPANLTTTLPEGSSGASYFDLWRGPDSISIYSSTKPWVPVGGSTFTLAGFPARRGKSPDGKATYLLIELPHGRYITLVGTGFGYDDLARIVTTTHLY